MKKKKVQSIGQLREGLYKLKMSQFQQCFHHEGVAIVIPEQE